MRADPKILTFIMAVVALSACGPANESTAEKDRKAEEYAASHGAKVDVQTKDDGTKSVTVDQSMGAMTGQTGTDLEVPKDFPSDVPLYPEMKIVAASQMPGMGSMLQGVSVAGLDKVSGYYETEMKAQGWTAGESQKSPGLHVTQYEKGDRAVSLTLMPVPEGTTVQIATMPKS